MSGSFAVLVAISLLGQALIVFWFVDSLSLNDEMFRLAFFATAALMLVDPVDVARRLCWPVFVDWPRK